MADTSAINSPDYWNQRFALDWTERGGGEQTAFFARIAVEMLPDWFWRDANKNALSLMDVGCALGEALPELKARMPQSALSGADVSQVAIGMAKKRLRQFDFHVVAEDWRDVPSTDIAFCSNTLEHFEDWHARLNRLGELAQRYVVALVPFQEGNLIEEHVASFDFSSFPPELPDGKSLIYFRIIDAAGQPESQWDGHQALALYGPRGKARKAAAGGDAYAGVDMRGLRVSDIKGTMASLRVAPPEVLAQRASPSSTQHIINRVNDEWSEKFASANADYMAKYAEMKTYYEQSIKERDAKITLFDQLMSARVELERARTVSEYQAAELRREREQNEALRASLARLPMLEDEAGQTAAVKKTLAEREAALNALEQQLNSTRADVGAAKSALRVAIHERDEARTALAQALLTPPADPGEIARLQAELAFAYEEKERHEANTVNIRDHYEEFVAGLRLELEQASAAAVEYEANAAALRGVREEAAAHERNVTAVRDHYEAHLRGINERLAQFSREMQGAVDDLRRTWQSAATRGQLDQQYARDLRALLAQVLTSKSWALAMRVRRLYLGSRGQGSPMPVVPEPPRGAMESGASEFLSRLDLVRGVLQQIAGDPNPAGASGVTQQHETPAQVAPPPQASAPQSWAPAPRAVPSGPVIAMQVASLNNGGLERVVLDLCMGLRQRGVRVLVIAVSRGGPIADELRQRGITVFEIKDSKEELERVLRDEAVSDLFLHHSYFAVDLAQDAGVRVYDVVHNYYFWHADKAKMIRGIDERCEKVIYVSSAVRAFHERVFGVPYAKGIVVNNPAHLDGLIVPDRAQLLRVRERQRDAVFLNVAQAFPAKAQPAMITAFARAHRARGGMRLQIAGAQVRDNAGEAVQRRIAEESIGDAVELLGHCDRRAMSRAYAQAHAFVLPSIYEGYSVSAIEAAAYGLPLIMTDVGGARDLIENGGCGILLPPASPDLARLSVKEIEQAGLAKENAATTALERAFVEIADRRAQWTQRGLEANFDIRSLDEVIDVYLSIAGVSAIARQ